MIRFTPEDRNIFTTVGLAFPQQGIGAESDIAGEIIRGITIVSGSLPPGILMNPEGIFSGVPYMPGESTIVVRAATDTQTQVCGFRFSINGDIVLTTPDITVPASGGSVANEIILTASGGLARNQNDYAFSVLAAYRVDGWSLTQVNTSDFVWMDISGGVNSWRANHVMLTRPRWMGNYQLLIGIHDLRNLQTPNVYKWLNLTATEPLPIENLWLDYLTNGCNTLPPPYSAVAQIGKKVFINLIETGTGHQDTKVFYLNDPKYSGWMPPAGWTVVTWTLVQEIPNTGDPVAVQPSDDDKDWFNQHKNDPLTGLWDMSPGFPSPEEMNEAITEFRAIYNEMINDVDSVIYNEITPQLRNPVERITTLNGGQQALANETARVYDTQNFIDDVILGVTRLSGRLNDFLFQHPVLFTILKADFTVPPDAQGDEELVKEVAEAKRLYDIIQNWISARKAWEPGVMDWVRRGLESIAWIGDKLGRSGAQMIAVGAIIQQIQSQSDRISNFPNVAADTIIDVLRWAVDTFFDLRSQADGFSDIAGTVPGDAILQLINDAIGQVLNKIIYVIESIL